MSNITSSVMYEMYKKNTDIHIEDINKEIKKIQRIRVPLLKYFRDNELPVHIDYEELKKGNETLIESPSDYREKYYNLQLKNFNTLNPIYKNKVKTLQRLQKYKMKKAIFFFILKRFNELLIQEMVYNNYKFFSRYIGGLFVISNKNKKPTINWGESIKIKEKLLQEGKIPYIKADAELASKEGREYAGVQWLIYMPERNLFFQWDLQNSQFIRLPNIKNFTFVPYRGDNSPVSLLMNFRKTLTDIQLDNFNTLTNAS